MVVNESVLGVMTASLRGPVSILTAVQWLWADWTYGMPGWEVLSYGGCNARWDEARRLECWHSEARRDVAEYARRVGLRLRSSVQPSSTSSSSKESSMEKSPRSGSSEDWFAPQAVKIAELFEANFPSNAASNWWLFDESNEEHRGGNEEHREMEFFGYPQVRAR